MRIESIITCNFIPDAKTETAQNWKVKVLKVDIRTPLYDLEITKSRIMLKFIMYVVLYWCVNINHKFFQQINEVMTQKVKIYILYDLPHDVICCAGFLHLVQNYFKK